MFIKHEFIKYFTAYIEHKNQNINWSHTLKQGTEWSRLVFNNQLIHLLRINIYVNSLFLIHKLTRVNSKYQQISNFTFSIIQDPRGQCEHTYIFQSIWVILTTRLIIFTLLSLKYYVFTINNETYRFKTWRKKEY